MEPGEGTSSAKQTPQPPRAVLLQAGSWDPLRLTPRDDCSTARLLNHSSLAPCRRRASTATWRRGRRPATAAMAQGRKVRPRRRAARPSGSAVGARRPRRRRPASPSRPRRSARCAPPRSVPRTHGAAENPCAAHVAAAGPNPFRSERRRGLHTTSVRSAKSQSCAECGVRRFCGPRVVLCGCFCKSSEVGSVRLSAAMLSAGRSAGCSGQGSGMWRLATPRTQSRNLESRRSLRRANGTTTATTATVLTGVRTEWAFCCVVTGTGWALRALQASHYGLQASTVHVLIEWHDLPRVWMCDDVCGCLGREGYVCWRSPHDGGQKGGNAPYKLAANGAGGGESVSGSGKKRSGSHRKEGGGKRRKHES